MGRFLKNLMAVARVKPLLSDEEFIGDGTLLQPPKKRPPPTSPPAPPLQHQERAQHVLRVHGKVVERRGLGPCTQTFKDKLPVALSLIPLLFKK